MRKFILMLICLTWAVSAHPFWIWSPNNQKWKNPQYSPLATPELQLSKAEDKFEAGHYKSALKEFSKILIYFPDAREAAEAQYYVGRCWEELSNPYRAFTEYQKVIDTYPNSKRIQDIVSRQYAIGEYFLNREPKKWLGLSLSALSEHPSIEIFKKVVANAPYAEYAPQAQYKLGLLYMKLRQYAEAKDALQTLLDNYPDSEWVEAGKYQMAIAGAKASSGVDYDGALRKEALQDFSEFLEKHPDTDLSEEAEGHFLGLREEEAKKQYNIAQFYERQKKSDSAIVYYEYVVSKYPDTEHAKKAEERLKELKP